MDKLITPDNLPYFANVNDTICKKPFRGIVVQFEGLGGQKFYGDTICDTGKAFAEEGILFVNPYINPWNWMNTQAIRITDEILDALYEKYGFDDIPLVYSGGSMGGQCAFVYSRYASRTPNACITNCPVCDLAFHYTERMDLPRTLYSAFYQENGKVEDALKRFSPFHLAAEMPQIKYAIWHCDNDHAVNIDSHTRRFVTEMGNYGKTIDFHIVSGRDHCDLTPEAAKAFHDCIVENMLKV